MRIGSAVDAHQQRDRCASANKFSAQKQGKGCVKMMNRTAYANFVTCMTWRTLADVDYCTQCPPLKRIISTHYLLLAEGGRWKRGSCYMVCGGLSYVAVPCRAICVSRGEIQKRKRRNDLKNNEKPNLKKRKITIKLIKNLTNKIMRKKFTMLFAALFLCMGTAWAYQFSYDKTFWTVPATSHEKVTEVPDDVFAVYNSNYSDQDELVADKVGVYVEEVDAVGGDVAVTLQYVGGNIRLDICGVDLVAADGSVAYKDYHFGWAGGNPSNNTYTLSDVAANSYTLRVFVASQKEDFTNANNDSRGNMTVTGVERPIVGSTAENKIFYQIKNVRSGKYANYEGADVQFTQVTTPTFGSYWYLMEVADATGVPEGYKAYRLYNAANTLAVENPTNGYMSENEGVTWPAKVYCIGKHTKNDYTGVVIRPLNDDDSSWNDANGAGQKIGTYSYDDPGSIWAFEKINVTESQLIQNAIAAKTDTLKTLAAEKVSTTRYFYGYELSAIEAAEEQIEAISVPENSLAEAMTSAIVISKMTPFAGLERVAPKAGDKFAMDNNERDGRLTAFAAGEDVKCTAKSSPSAYFDVLWTLVATETEGQFKLYNEKMDVYVGVLSNNNNTTFKYVSAAEDAGVYELANVDGYATFKRVGGRDTDHLHLSNWSGKEIVRWDNGGPSQWRLVKAVGPELTTDVNNPICYALKSGRDGNYYFTLDANKVKLFTGKAIATDEATHWYFMLEEGNLKMYSSSDDKAMGYLTGTDGNTKLTNDDTAADYDSNTYTLYFAPYNQTEFNGAWFALKPSRGDTYVSNHGGTGNYMGFYNNFNDAGTRVAFESVDGLKLAAKVSECEAKVVGDAIGLYAVSGGDAESVLADAKAALQGNNNVVAYRSNLAALEALTYTLNVPETGKFYRLKNVVSNNYMSGNASGITLLTNGSAVASTIFYLGENNTLLSYASGLYLDCQAKGNAPVGTSYQGEFGLAYGGATANVITYKNNGYWTFGNRSESESLDRGQYDPNQEGYNWVIEEVTWLPVAMNATVGWATFYSPVQLELSSNRVKAYTGLVEGNVVKLNEQSVVPANTGVILELQQGAEVENGYVFLEISKSENVAVEDNDLNGTFADTYVSEAAYVLANKNDVVGLYKATLNQQDGTAFLNQGFKAYLPASAKTANAPMFSFTRGDEEDTTGIELISNDGELVIYDLAGRRVEKMEKGIYIVNGKKVVK